MLTEGPTGAVPQSAQEEDDDVMEVRPAWAAPVAAQGNVDVIPEPGGERDVPAPPELPDGSGHIGIVEVLKELESRDVDWITLAGYLKLIPSEVVQRYKGHIMNIHPALLPSFGGKGMYGEHVHQAVIESGVKVSGASVHIVDEEYDTGPIVIQETVPVHFEDTPESLAARVLEVEHRVYPKAVELAVTNKIRRHGRRVEILP